MLEFYGSFLIRAGGRATIMADDFSFIGHETYTVGTKHTMLTTLFKVFVRIGIVSTRVK